jgi:hypothetical protein
VALLLPSQVNWWPLWWRRSSRLHLFCQSPLLEPCPAWVLNFALWLKDGLSCPVLINTSNTRLGPRQTQIQI